ncbi:molybdopterin molybdenumtransferase MoeA [Candidatus Endobugula sertula]|uniref:Molybdopterin molybdenumtransferase n=1 Tax=Candidatus Endobugula sertula TaxID=62101 RepID=A0A1D2QMJ1_9GAMM|nr:molybdopterin molybdenumtransferase MoeA [Candidatus Endobugula sertula]
MLSINDAIEQLLTQVNPVMDTESVSLANALGRVLSTNICSNLDVPPTDNSAMDGYAINTSNLDDKPLRISQIVAAGHRPSPLTPGTAARIFTGAEIPDGANAVVMQEACIASHDEEGDKVQLPTFVKINHNIRPQGQDITSGDVVLSRGRQLQPQDIGLLASIGVGEVTVYRQLTVAILSSGDELIEPGIPLLAGKIYNSNRYLLISFLQKMGLNILDIGTVKDTQEATIIALQQAEKADCIISTGGVSVGNEDHIKKAVQQLGNIHFWRIAIKPGKPVAIGHINQTPFIGLPGNPAAVFTTFLLIAHPFLLAQQHQEYRPPKTTTVVAAFNWQGNLKRQEYLRAKLNAEGTMEIYPNQSSGILSSTVWADGFVVVPPQTPITVGDKVEFMTFF